MFMHLKGFLTYLSDGNINKKAVNQDLFFNLLQRNYQVPWNYDTDPHTVLMVQRVSGFTNTTEFNEAWRILERNICA